MWILGVALLLAVPGWVAHSLWAWRHLHESSVTRLQAISQTRQARYHNCVNQITQHHACGELDERGTHLAVAGLTHTLGTKCSGRDLGVATIAEVHALIPTWSQLALVLEACETSSFIGEHADGAAGRPSLPGGAQEASGIDILTLASQAVDA